jgi:hypothetical protein
VEKASAKWSVIRLVDDSPMPGELGSHRLLLGLMASAESGPFIENGSAATGPAADGQMPIPGDFVNGRWHEVWACDEHREGLVDSVRVTTT